jgi:hypothetical protein
MRTGFAKPIMMPPANLAREGFCEDVGWTDLKNAVILHACH